MAGLDQERIVDAAVDLADSEGIEPLTIRRLAAILNVGAMSIYHYLPNKDAILTAMVDRVFAEILLPPAAAPWRDAIALRCASMREALGRHPWAVGLMNSSREPGPASLAHHEAMLVCLREAGFSIPATAHTFALLDAYVYGFAVQAASLPFNGPEDLADITEAIAPSDYPRMAEFAQEHALQPGYDFNDEFAVGLDVVLDGVERAWAP